MAVDPILVVAAGLWGLCLGSFLNVCILRLANEDKKQRSLFHPPSTCPRCGRRIAWRDNIPIVSWLVLRGRCRSCGKPISMQYPIIEAVVGVLWIAALLAYGPTVRFLTAGVLGTRTPTRGIRVADCACAARGAPRVARPKATTSPSAVTGSPDRRVGAIRHHHVPPSSIQLELDDMPRAWASGLFAQALGRPIGDGDAGGLRCFM